MCQKDAIQKKRYKFNKEGIYLSLKVANARAKS